MAGGITDNSRSVAGWIRFYVSIFR
jgi:hypothetical protein